MTQLGIKGKKIGIYKPLKACFSITCCVNGIVYGERGKFYKWLFWHFNFNCCQRFEGV